MGKTGGEGILNKVAYPDHLAKGRFEKLDK